MIPDIKKIRKIDAIIIVALIVIAGIIFLEADYFPKGSKEQTPEMSFKKDELSNTLILGFVSGDNYKWKDFEIQGNCNTSQLSGSVDPNDAITECHGEIVIRYIPTDEIIDSWIFEEEKPPGSIFFPNNQVVSPTDEGNHYDKLLVNREWWTWTAVFDKNSDLAGWTITVSFMHLARGDLMATLKPDALVLTLHSPDGKEYGGIINKERGFDLLNGPTLEAKTPGVNLKFENSWAEGEQPFWHLHVEDDDIDEDVEIIVDVDCSVSSDPIWTHSISLFDKGDSNIASYIFTGMKMSGSIKIDGKEYDVDGMGHHHHTWSNGLLKPIIKGWDYCHMKFENGWNIYYSKYYLLTSERGLSSESKFNPCTSIIITADNGDTITELKNIDIQTDSKTIFGKVKIPIEINIQAEPDLSQSLLKTYGIRLDLTIENDNIYEKVFNSIPQVGINIGRTNVNGKISWSEDNKEYEVDLTGTGCLWTMRH